MPASTFTGNVGLNCALRATPILPPPGVHLHAYNGDPRAAGTELASIGSYAPIAIPTFGAAQGNASRNSTNALFPRATANWTTPWDWIAIIDGNTNLWWACDLTVDPQSILTGQIPTIPVGLIQIEFLQWVGTALGNGLLDVFLFGSTLDPPDAMFLAPFFGNPLAGGIELTTGGASRIACPPFAAAVDASTKNLAGTSWDGASNDWLNACTHLAYIDAATGGDIWIAQPLAPGQIVLQGDVPTIFEGGLTVSMT